VYSLYFRLIKNLETTQVTGRNYSVKHEWNAKDVTQWNEHRGPCCH
jgi:hypothetical protein